MDITTIYYDIDNFCKFVAQSSFPRLSVSNVVYAVFVSQTFAQVR